MGKQPYAYWRKHSFPHVEERVEQGVPLNIELVLLEDTPEYLHIAVNVDDGRWLNTIMPVGSSFIVRRPEDSTGTMA